MIMERQRPALERAKFSRRLFASLIDLIVFLAFFGGLVYLFGDISSTEGLSASEIKLLEPEENFGLTKSLFLLAQFFGFLYTLCEVFFAKTLGKKLLGLEIVSLNDPQKSTLPLFFRWLLKSGAAYIGVAIGYVGIQAELLPILLNLWSAVITFGFLRVFQDHRQALHDKFSKTIVVVKGGNINT